ncbi:MAG: hypothetical protein HY077_01315 [Elusimicrobia bacterium]|nr:hypothetical protein [Elusimicrobiota bacterium]
MKDGGRFEGTIMAVKADDLEVSIAGRTLVIRKDSIGWIDYEPEWDGKTSRKGELVLKAGIGAALPLPAYAFNNIARPGLASDVEFLINVEPSWAFGFRTDAFAYTTAYPQSETAVGKAQVNGGDLLFEGRWLALPERKLSPFLVGGLGVNTYTEEFELAPKPGFKWLDTGTRETRELEDTSVGMAAMLGVGAQYLISRHYVADVEAAWHWWRIDSDKFSNFMQQSSFAQAVSLMARLGWRF